MFIPESDVACVFQLLEAGRGSMESLSWGSDGEWGKVQPADVTVS